MSYLKLNLTNPSHRYIPELDGVRGLAILLVVLYHCFPVPLTGFGWIGVDLFFVLSGFLITGILIDSKGSRKYYVNFIGRRVLRIFPLYYLVLFVLLFLVPTLGLTGPDSSFDFYTKHQSWFWSYLQNWLFSLQGLPQNLMLAHFWSLAVEEQFYLFWPWVILLMPGRYLLRISIYLCLVSVVFRLLPPEWLNFTPLYRYVNTFSRMDALLLGGIIAQLIRGNKNILEKIALPTGILGLIVFVVGIIINGSLGFMKLSYYYTAIDLFMGMILILSLSNVKWIRHVLRYSALTFLGKYSYGIYVYQAIIYIILRYKTGAWLTIHLAGFSSTIVMLIFGIIVVALSLITSILSYHLFEAHFLKLKIYFRNDNLKLANGNQKKIKMGLNS